ncbi:MAG: ABC transporter ATP-binding protein [bacterium]|nr:ABC transporter ATP-binding protein [bacterium]
MKRSENGNPIFYLSEKMWKYSKGNRRNVVLYGSLFVMANVVAFVEPLIIAKVLNIVQEQGVNNQSLPSLFFFLSLLLLQTLGYWIFHAPARLLEMRNAFFVRAQYKKHLLDGVMAFSIEWHTDHHSGDTIDKIGKGTTALYEYSESTFQIIISFFSLVSSYIALMYFNLHASYIVLFMVIMTISILLQFDKVIVRQYSALYLKENKIAEKIFDTISNITTVIILRIEAIVSSSMYGKIMEPFKLFKKNLNLNEAKWFLVSISSKIMAILVLGSYFYFRIGAGEAILVGTVYALYEYVQRISELFTRFAYMYNDILQQKAAVMNAEEISNEFSTIEKVEPLILDSQWNELRIESLSFSYHTEGGADLHLDNVSLSIKRGERVAFIGESGSGKTTMLKIIRELYRPTQGKVYLDGNLLEYGFQSISPNVTLIPQDPEIFSTTIEENITVGVPHDAEEIKKFTDMACFSAVVERLPRKLASFIHEKGVNLSGGEKQRLALARGLMASQDKSIVLFDEPTSSVDTRNELRIFNNIFNEFQGKTIVASVHRLHLLSLFDTIYFFDKGKIIASGFLQELLTESPEFQELWDKYHKAGKRAPKLIPVLSA